MKVNINKYEAFIFDFDGVIVDSIDIKTKAFAQMYKTFGKEVVSKVVNHHISHGGLSRFEKIHFYHKNYLNKKIDKTELKRLAQVFSGLVEEKVLKAPSIEGALDFLNLLKKKRKKMFVISATPQDEMKKIVAKRKLAEYFTDVKGSPRSKKENLEHIIKQYKVNNSECIYFGDSKEDFETASLLRIKFIPINYFDRSRGYRNFIGLIKEINCSND